MDLAPCLRSVSLTILLSLSTGVVGCDEPARNGARPAPDEPAGPWTDSELAVLETLRRGALPPAPPDRGNAFGDDARAARLGEALFHDPGLSGSGTIACATCHPPGRHFADGRRVSHGLAPLRRNAPSLVDVAYVPWLYWDGRADSLWSQALVPIEAPNEMGGTRAAAVAYVAESVLLARLYREVFGAPISEHALDRAYSNLGKAIAAYERTLRSPRTRFDAYVSETLDGRHGVAAEWLDAREVDGLRAFIGVAGCIRCHLGPRFTDDRFHNVGTGDLGLLSEDLGRAEGRRILRDFEFNCASAFSDGATCGHLEEMMASEVPSLLRGAFRTPGLRGLVQTAPYMHDGRFQSLEQVVSFYVSPPDKATVQHELPLRLDLDAERASNLAAFLAALSSPAE